MTQPPPYFSRDASMSKQRMLCLPVCLQPPQRESWGAQDAKNEHTHQFKCEPPEIPGLRLHGVGSRQVYRKLEAQRTR